MGTIFNRSGGYRRLYSFNFATIIHLGTISFVRRFVDWKDDPLGKLAGQMVGASRSGKQNIVEGSERAKTSTETEIKLTDVAKGSLAELLGDLEDFLACRNSIPWSIHSDDYKAVNSITLEPFAYMTLSLSEVDRLYRQKYTRIEEELKKQKDSAPWFQKIDIPSSVIGAGFLALVAIIWKKIEKGFEKILTWASKAIYQKWAGRLLFRSLGMKRYRSAVISRNAIVKRRF